MAHQAKILVVDDDPIMRELAAAKLTDAGYGVVTATDGADAMSVIANNQFDLVIVDLEMPRMTGYQVTEQMRADPATATTPVIVITGSDHASAVEQAFAAGATSFIAKPVNWSLLAHSVKFVLRAAQDERDLRTARDQAEAGARFKDSLMSLMSHELRTPLNAIIGFGQILGEQFEKDCDNLHREYADYIVEGGKRLLNSVSDMLLASDARSGPIDINEVDCTVQDLVTLAISSCEKNAEIANASIKLAIQDPELEVRCDRQLIARALGKLIDNSIKFAHQKVDVVIGATQTPAGDIAFVVKDNGPGIEADKLRVVTQPFTQSDMSLRRSKEGLGLGLPLVQAIAAAHNAKFKLDATPGGGACAVILLPKDRVITTPAATKVA